MCTGQGAKRIGLGSKIKIQNPRQGPGIRGGKDPFHKRLSHNWQYEAHTHFVIPGLTRARSEA